MRTVLLALLVIASPFISLAQGKKVLEEKYGFRQMQFESAASTYPDLVERPTDNPNSRRKLYGRASDEMKVGEAVLSDIVYEFYDGRLAVVTVRTEGFGNSRALQNALRAQYGPGSPPLLVTDESSWDTKRVRLYYRRNQYSGDAYMRLSSKVMRDVAEKGDKEAAKSAKSDL